ncbi:MAG: NAD-dependent epimerase/dehydratase family protein [Planctomycetaceae bacterium]|jgi:nucleoside-diphosphate-sugar epimerase|nr:NAD-dependent epimerase/dehydratase family protein [Planctomycetaceae bacterium]
MNIQTVEQLDDALSLPPDSLVKSLAKLDGDILVLGVAGKMGPTLARMAKRASDQAGVVRRVIGVARFSNPAVQKKLDAWGIETVKTDLLDEQAMAALPDAPNIVFMAGMKFGSTGNESLTWAMNTVVPAIVASRYRDSRIAAFSTGNVYGLVPVSSGGSIETDSLNPAGEYAMSCLGRERIFEHFSRTNGTPLSIIRLNYACELRYGVLVDLATKIRNGQPIDLTMGSFNVIWQGDANAHALASLSDCNSPPFVINVTGSETLSVRTVSEQLAERLSRPVEFVGEESPTALLNNARVSHDKYGLPEVPISQLLNNVADWVSRDGETLDKPTGFEVRNGKF